MCWWAVARSGIPEKFRLTHCKARVEHHPSTIEHVCRLGTCARRSELQFYGHMR
jgi:hypothetical protein